MAFINVSESYTLHVGPASSNQFAKIVVEVNGINTDFPLEEQLQKVKDMLPDIFNIIEPELDRRITANIGAQIVR